MQAVLNGIHEINGIPFRVALIPPGKPNRSGFKLNGGTYVKSTVHETGNTDAGANAEMHRKFVWNGGGDDNVSFHAVVDDHEIIQLLPFDEVAWHAGDGPHGPGNCTSIATETCVNSDGDSKKALQHLAVWQNFLLDNGRLTLAEIVQHNHWSGKDCPHYMRLSNGAQWDDLRSLISGEVLHDIVIKPNVRYFEPTRHSIGGGFKAEWERMEALGLVMQVIGYPITEEMQETIDLWTGTVQYFERARFEWHTESGPGKVIYGRIGSEDAKLKGVI